VNVRCVLAILLACACEHDDDFVLERDASIDLDEARCPKCHRAEAEQWASSRHHTSFTNADFQRAYEREPEPFCRDCHAPGGDEVQGVGCLECHGDGDAILTGPGDDVRAPHAIVRVDDFGTRSCAACHEFAFPESSRRPPDAMMQTTMREHAASAFADRSCADCHMPAHAHDLASTRDDDAWRRALTIAASREGDDLVLVLTPHEVGHALPTGDLFRRLALHAELRVDDEIVDTETRWLGRHFAPRRRPDGSLDPEYDWPTPDDRILEQTKIRLDLEGDGELVWWVDYERVDHRHEEDPATSTIASTIRLAAGRL
jgi:hypothetical protein